ncbi:unnamed protein product [Polarella glacialis]|uniref:Uncharacterized protein n=1 Tax=Polarella glacialis TaxID=89957 RepID=A0A813FBT3_POLGL|nr:unnamed protein product [Polarella glacialis]
MKATVLRASGSHVASGMGMSYTGFRIGCYGSVRDLILGGSDGGGILGGLGGRLAAGAITGAVGSAIFAPTDVVRIRMQGFSPYSSTPAAFVAVVSDEGVSGLWRGAGASMLRATLLSSSQLAVYDTAKQMLKGKLPAFSSEEGAGETPALHFTASLLSGFAAQTVAQPADTLKTVAMAARSGNTLEALRDALHRGGLRSLYRGYWPALARQGPVMVVQMPLVEQLRKLLGLDFL